MITSLSNFLPEIQMMILEELPPASLRVISLVDKYFANLALDNSLWKGHLKRDYPDNRYTIEWEHCFKEYSRLKKKELKVMSSKLEPLWVAIEENNVEKIKEIFGKIPKGTYLSFTLGRLINAQKNDEIYQFLSQAIPAIQDDDFDKLVWNLIFEKEMPYDDECSPIALCWGGVFNFDSDLLDESQKTNCLHAAASGGHIEIFESLVQKNKHWNTSHLNILERAVDNGHSKFVDYYYKTFSPSLSKDQLLQLAMKASELPYLSTLEILASHFNQPEDFQEIFNNAYLTNFIDCMCYLIEKGADVNTRIKKSKNTPLYCTVVFKVYPAAQFLLSKGANPNIDFPLDVALKNKDEKMIQLLHENGAKTSF